MSWIDKANNGLIITTGDGESFNPNWVNASKSKEFNISEFDFPEISGTLVKRSSPRGRKFNLEILFQGENHLDISSKFEVSSDDKRAWVISHPLYDRILVQPISLIFDNSNENVTRIQAQVMETIDEVKPSTSINTASQIETLKSEIDEIIVDSYVNEVTPTTDDGAQIAKENEKLFAEGKKKIKINIDFDKYFEAFKKAQAAASKIVLVASNAIRTIQAVINAPALFVNNIKNKIETLKNQWDTLRNSVDTILGRNGKKTHEILASSLISSMPLAMVSGVDFDNAIDSSGQSISRRDLIDSLEIMLDSYNQHVTDLDTLQSDDYTPDFDTQFKINSLILLAFSALPLLLQNARQERQLYLENDSNIILLAHRFIGIKKGDLGLIEFMRINNFGLNEYLQVKKGRLITYYI